MCIQVQVYFPFKRCISVILIYSEEEQAASPVPHIHLLISSQNDNINQKSHLSLINMKTEAQKCTVTSVKLES